MTPENIRELSLVTYSHESGQIQHTRKWLNRPIPSGLAPGGGKEPYRLEGCKPDEKAEYSEFPVNTDTYQIPPEISDLVPANGIAIAKDYFNDNSPFMLYSNNGSLSQEELQKRPELSSLIKRLEASFPDSKKSVDCIAYIASNGSPEYAKVIMDENSLPETIYHNKTEYHPMLWTNDTCVHTGGNFCKVNGDYSGGSAILDSEHSPNAIMLNERGNNSVYVYMPKERTNELKHILDPDSGLRDAVQQMYAEYRENLINK